MTGQTKDSESELPGQKEITVVETPKKTNKTKKHSLETDSSTIGDMLMLVQSGISPELFVISLVYFVQGFIALASIAVSFFLKDVLHQGPAEVAMLEGLSTLPWMIKPLYGFMSDFFPLFGYRRRSYLILCGFLSAFAWMFLGSSVESVYGTAAMMLLSSAATACCDVVVDSIVVERARGEPQETSGSLQSLCWASWSVGAIVSSYSGGYFVQSRGPRFVFRAIAMFPLIVAIGAFLIKETPKKNSKPSTDHHGNSSVSSNGLSPGTAPPQNQRNEFLPPDLGQHQSQTTMKSQIVLLWEAFSQPSIYLPTLFMFTYNAMPNSSSAFFFFETNELRFGPEFLGRVAFLGQITRLGGVGVYRFFLRSVPLRKMFKWCCIVSTAVGMTQIIVISRWNTQIGLSDGLFVLGDSAVLEAIGQVAFMPLFVLAARICPEGVEATLFALLMSILNGGNVASGFMGALLTKMLGVTETDYTHLGALTVLCMMSNLIPLLLINLIPEEKQSSADAHEE